MVNPLLTENKLPAFSTITPQHMAAALDTCLSKGRKLINKLIQQPYFTWDNLVAPLEEQDDKLNKIWSSIKTE